ncbi:hypothetical protein ACLQ2Q_19275 [Microbacterium sp. DT81.1]|uniref:hypothetical protein n=1 Tax=Microbacterium sp. DT81.1 TaxID=3393413 RepID=UPI003CEA350F
MTPEAGDGADAGGGTDAGGTTAPGWWSPSRTWSCGDWSLELRGDELADIRFRRRLLLRGVRAVVRDADWGTVPTRVVDAEPGESQLTVRLAMEGLGLSVHGTLTAAVEGDALEIRWRAVSAQAAETNRVGLVLLHPPGLAGGPLTVRHPDGTTTAMRFPIDISPHQPALDIFGMDWRFDGGEARLSLSGDVFEMEDQRNWTDASYKTYSRPLALPFPYSLAEGEVPEQTARLEVTPADALGAGTAASQAARHRATPPGNDAAGPVDRIELVEAGAFPSIGVAASTAPDPAPGPAPGPTLAGASGSAPGTAFVLVELDLATPNWRAALERAARSGVPLDVRVVADTRDDLHSVVDALSALPVTRIGIYDRLDSITLPPLRDALRRALSDRGLALPVIGGARSHFTELNRGAELVPGDLDALTFSVTPLFHTLDTEQLVESVPIQRLVAEQAVRMAVGRPVHIGPVTLRPRFNNVATRPTPTPAASDLSEGYGAAFTDADDPRMAAPELAAWTVASAAALAVDGVATLCYFEEWGPRGIRSSDGSPRPVVQVLGWLSELDGASLFSGPSRDGTVWALGGRHEGRTTVIAANIGHRDREVTVSTPAGEVVLRLGSGEATRVALTPQ